MNHSGRAFTAAVFDLDGVVTLTARMHFRAWKRLFDELTRSDSFDHEAYKRWVDGKPRLEGLSSYLDAASIPIPEDETLATLADRKNVYFNQLLEREGAEVDAKAVALIRQLRAKSIRVGLATSSRNGGSIVKRAGIESLFDARIDGVESARLGLRGKPHPDIFLACLKGLGEHDPSSAVMFEDATSGVAAGRAGGFGLVVGVDREESWIQLREHGADWIIRDFDELDVDRLALWMFNRGHVRPNMLMRWSQIEERLRGEDLAIFLDYDGTLTPIVSRPELALLSDDARAALGRAAAEWPVAVVSGRGLEDLKAKVRLDSVWYVGNHGFEIEGPGDWSYRVLPDLENSIHRVAEQLRPRVEQVAGAILEDKKFSAAVHYRMASEERARDLERAIDEVLMLHPELTKSYGKKVFEIRSAIHWDKGRAVLWLMEEMGASDAIPIYAGDDVTDEDALAAVLRRGLGVLVSELPRSTEARWSLQNPGEVRLLLERLAALGRK